MKVLTLTQPWATLVAIGAKRIETRGWETSYRGPLAIHAGKNLGPVGGKTGLRQIISQRIFGEALIAGGVRWETDLPLGAIVAVARLAYVVPTVAVENGAHPGFGKPDSTWPLSDQERAFGDYSPGRYAWLLADVQRLEAPVVCTGRLGLWDVPPMIAAQIAAQLAAARAAP